MFNDLGCTESLNYFLPKYIIKNEYGKAKYLLKITLLLQIASSLLIAVILFIVAPWLARVYFEQPFITDILRISGLYFIGINIFHIASVLFVIAQNTKLQKGVEFLKLFFTAVGTLLVFYFGFKRVEPYMWIWVSGTIFGAIIAVYFAYTRYYSSYFKDVEIVFSYSDRNHFLK